VDATALATLWAMIALFIFLGITVYLSIPTSIPRYSVIAGAVLALAGAALAFTRRTGRNSSGEVVESAGSGSTEL